MVLAALCLGGARLDAATFTASLDRDTIALGESATLSLTFEDGSPRTVPMPPNVAGLQIAYVGPSSQFSFVNGETKSTVTYNFTLTPRQAGEFHHPDAGRRRWRATAKFIAAEIEGAAAEFAAAGCRQLRLGSRVHETYTAGRQVLCR